MAILLKIVQFVFVVWGWFAGRKARRLEATHADAATDANICLREVEEPLPVILTGAKAKAMEAAKRQYRLGGLVQRRDELCAQWTAAQGRAERLRGVASTLKSWQGRKLPYTLGALDLATAAAAIDRLGLWPYLTADGLKDLAMQGWALFVQAAPGRW